MNVTRVRVIAYREIRGRVLSNVRSCVFDVDFAGVEMSGTFSSLFVICT